MAARESIPVDVKRHVLHLCGYKCSNPSCRTILTLDLHHMEPVSVGGGNAAENLLALCPNCHALHHRDSNGIPIESIRAWHQLLLAINEAYPRLGVDVLLTLHKLGTLRCSGDGLLGIASAVAAGMIKATWKMSDSLTMAWEYELTLEPKGRIFVEGWISGDQRKALGAEAIAMDEVDES